MMCNIYIYIYIKKICKKCSREIQAEREIICIHIDLLKDLLKE